MPLEEQLDFIDGKVSQNGENDKNLLKANIQSKNKLISHFKYRFCKTSFLFISWICLGLFSEILGPALPSLRILTNSNYEEIARALSARAGGLLAGSFIGGFLSDKFSHKRSFLVFIFLSIAGITVATIPLCKSLVTLSFNLFISGFSHGAFTTAGNPLLGSLWKKSTGPYNFMHSGYGLGAAIAPLLLNLFEPSDISFRLQNITLVANLTNLKESAQYIQPSFNIVGISCIVVALVFLLFCFISNPVDELEETFCRKKHATSTIIKAQDQLPETFFARIKVSLMSNIKKLHRKILIITSICFISYFGIVGNERVFGKFQFSYATEGPLQISKNKGYIINCLYWVSFCVARIIMAVLAIKIPSKILLVVEILGTIICSLVFTIWNKDKLIFYIFSTLFGFFKSPLFPTMLGVLSLYTPISGWLVIVVNFGSAAGAMSCQYLAGYLIEYYGHYTFPITVTVTGFVLGVIITIMLSVTRRWKQI